MLTFIVLLVTLRKPFPCRRHFGIPFRNIPRSSDNSFQKPFPGAPSGAQQGSTGQTKLSFFVFRMVFGVFMVYHLVKIDNFRLGTYSNNLCHFWNFPSVHQIWTPGTLIYYQNTSTNARKNPNCSQNILFLHISTF